MKALYSEYLKKVDFLIQKSKYTFVNGLAITEKDGLLGCLNEKLEWQIQPKYFKIYPFINGFSLVVEKKHIGLKKIIRVEKGKRIFNFQDPFKEKILELNEEEYEYCIYFIDSQGKLDNDLPQHRVYSDLFFYKNLPLIPDMSILDVTGKYLFPADEVQLFIPFRGSNSYFFEVQTKQLLELQKNRIIIHFVRKKESFSLNFKFKNLDFQECIIYDKNLSQIFKGKTLIGVGKAENLNPGKIFTNYSNKFGFAIIDKDNKFGWMDIFGRIVLEPQFYELYYFQNDEANNIVTRKFIFRKSHNWLDFGTFINLDLIEDIYLKPTNTKDYLYFNKDYLTFLKLI